MRIKHDHKPIFAVLFGIAVIMSSCAGEQSPSATDEKTELLTKTKWKLTGFVVKSGSRELNMFSSIPTCSTDNLWNFKADQTFEMTEGATKCAPSDADVVEVANWEFGPDQASILLDDKFFTLESLSSTELRLSMTEDDDGEILTWSYILGH